MKKALWILTILLSGLILGCGHTADKCDQYGKMLDEALAAECSQTAGCCYCNCLERGMVPDGVSEGCHCVEPEGDQELVCTAKVLSSVDDALNKPEDFKVAARSLVSSLYCAVPEAPISEVPRVASK